MRDAHASVNSRFIPMTLERILFRRARVAACSNPSNATGFSFFQKNGQRESPIRYLAIGAIVTTRRARTRRATKRFRRRGRAGWCRHLVVRLCARARTVAASTRARRRRRARRRSIARSRARVSRSGRRRARDATRGRVGDARRVGARVTNGRCARAGASRARRAPPEGRDLEISRFPIENDRKRSTEGEAAFSKRARGVRGYVSHATSTTRLTRVSTRTERREVSPLFIRGDESVTEVTVNENHPRGEVVL